jgi:hypothetical protein
MRDTNDDFLMALMNVPEGCCVIPGWDVHRVMRSQAALWMSYVEKKAEVEELTEDNALLREQNDLLGQRLAELDAAPAAPAPLTDERINLIDKSTHFHESPDWCLRFARAIERAHGITKGGAV